MAYTVEEQADEAKNCEDAEASVYHVHVRDERGANSGDPEIYGKLVEQVRTKSETLIQIGGALGPVRDPRHGCHRLPVYRTRQAERTCRRSFAGHDSR